VSGGVVGIVVLRRYIDRAPLLRRMLLNPPKGEELEALRSRESLVLWDHLIGQTGVTVTPLRPAGKAYFGNELVDVITEGDAVDRNEQVVVIDVRGSHVIVTSRTSELS
jgi:membrane-bound ClpP family serine protease